jgi:glycosyltransferase involved in cell wall biosynthesis
MRTRNPRFSIIIPTFNRPDFLLKAVNSILAQDFEDFEIIVQDGGTHHAVLPQDDRIFHIKAPDEGLADALNQGFAAACGEILNESNDDDLMLPDTLSIVDRLIGAYKWVYGQIDYGGTVAGDPWDFERLKRENFVPQPAVFFRRDAYKEVGEFDVENDFAADYDMWLKLGAKYAPLFIPRPLAYYTVHDGQITKTKLREQLAHAERIRQKHAGTYHGA